MCTWAGHLRQWVASADRLTATPESRVPGHSLVRRTQGQIMKGLGFHAKELDLDPKLENLIVHFT